MKEKAFHNKLEDINSFWKSLREGDRNGLEGIYRIFSKDLFQYGMTISGDADFIQDCIQEVFIDIWKYHKNLQKADNVKMYLLRSLNHKIFRESKKEKKWEKEKINEDLEEFFFIESKENELVNDQREQHLQKRLANALDDLPIRQKEVIQYLFFEDITYEEASKLMGINLRSVYTLAWKAVSNLKKTILSVLLVLTYYN